MCIVLLQVSIVFTSTNSGYAAQCLCAVCSVFVKTLAFGVSFYSHTEWK